MQWNRDQSIQANLCPRYCTPPNASANPGNGGTNSRTPRFLREPSADIVGKKIATPKLQHFSIFLLEGLYFGRMKPNPTKLGLQPERIGLSKLAVELVEGLFEAVEFWATSTHHIYFLPSSCFSGKWVPSFSTEHGMRSSPHLYGHVKQNVAWAKIHENSLGRARSFPLLLMEVGLHPEV